MTVRCKSKNKNTEITHEIGYACDYVKILTAREMFEELGYELDDCSNFEGMAKCLNYQIKKPFECIFKEIAFYLETKEIGWDNVMLTMPLLKAINKQVEELHWND